MSDSRTGSGAGPPSPSDARHPAGVGPDPRRAIPGVDTLLASTEGKALLEDAPRVRVSEHLRRAVATIRARLDRGEPPPDLADPALYVREAARSLAAEDVPSLRPVINATGVVLHTNLGRAPLAREALAAMAATGPGYTNLELDLETGRRGSRYTHCAWLVSELTGSEDALVVNNCAAALVLAVNTLAAGGRVAVSRGELVEIGGSFRIPEILGRAGAELVEVGSTNRTRVQDYAAAARDAGIQAILKVHRSNFRMTGFTEEVSLSELAAVAEEVGVPLVHDVGSGLLIDPAKLGLPEEPRPETSLRQGAQLVVFSGDKLLGGPQAGLVAGTRGAVGRMRSNPLCRALRVDKTTLAGLEATLRLYRDPETVAERVPALRMIVVPVARLEDRARSVAERLSGVAARLVVEPGASAVGGGTFPGVELPTWTVRLEPAEGTVEDLASRLRDGEPPVVGRRESGTLVLDLRTVDEEDEDGLVAALARALPGSS